MRECPRCHEDNCRKYGQDLTRRQRWHCLECGKIFTDTPRHPSGMKLRAHSLSLHKKFCRAALRLPYPLKLSWGKMKWLGISRATFHRWRKNWPGY